MKKFFPYQHSLRDGDDLEGMDRGDEVVVKGEAPPTDEEKRLAEELKQKQ